MDSLLRFLLSDTVKILFGVIMILIVGIIICHKIYSFFRLLISDEPTPEQLALNAQVDTHIETLQRAADDLVAEVSELEAFGKTRLSRLRSATCLERRASLEAWSQAHSNVAKCRDLKNRSDQFHKQVKSYLDIAGLVATDLLEELQFYFEQAERVQLERGTPGTAECIAELHRHITDARTAISEMKKVTDNTTAAGFSDKAFASLNRAKTIVKALRFAMSL